MSNRMDPSQPAAPRFVDSYLPALLALASQLISGEFHEVARQHGLSISEWRVMASLADGNLISIGDLAQLTVTKQPTITRLLDRMESKGQVERVPHPSDRRITLVHITPDGSQTIKRLIELAQEHENQVLEPFGLTRAEELKKTLRQIITLHTVQPDGGGARGSSAYIQASTMPETSDA
ncbi:MAG: MarR family transcriptional regulator [Castellaniella sp.]|nr:MarR family transcriptional regulator [Castellaniella sp.]